MVLRVLGPLDVDEYIERPDDLYLELGRGVVLLHHGLDRHGLLRCDPIS